MGATDQTVRARATRRFSATTERVYAAWLDPAKIRDWFGPGLGPIVRIDVESRVGGRFCWVQRRGDSDVEHVGEFLELESPGDPGGTGSPAPGRIAFTFAVPPDPVSRVFVDILPAGGGSEVTVTHEIPVEWAAFVPRSVEAWGKMLDAMAAVA